VILQDKIDDDWGFVVLARDEMFRFRAIQAESNLPSRSEARMALQMEMTRLLSEPQRVFPQ
jgi:hypothetical protein